jgi:hypothetical protein
MCLNRLLPIPEYLPNMGYKVFLHDKVHDRLYFSVMGVMGTIGQVRINEWLKSNKYLIIRTMHSNETYEPGFHVFLDKQSAIDYIKHWNIYESIHEEVLYEVIFSDVTAYGEQCVLGSDIPHRCVVCDKIYILPRSES